ncbi:uncharacterized protein PWA37_003420 [Arxiozyma heterogenica]|uniref:Uncharacterized protein n=1 Tax=Arxiozyma heterogenica TaxID=278026 RepID=A0AAN8A7G9_9SACH|nr:hypothetical protein RI543_001889 [Kazachstania heterogenica]
MTLIKKVGLPVLFGMGTYYVCISDQYKNFCNSKCFWTRTNEQVRQILDHSQETHFLHDYSKLFQNNDSVSNANTVENKGGENIINTTSNVQLLLVLSKVELLKDIWNYQVYKLWNWLYSS